MIVALVRLMRLYYAVPFSAGFVVIVSYLTAGEVYAIRHRLLLACLSLCSVVGAAYVLNDVCDLAADRVNRPKAALVRGMVSRTLATAWSIALFALGLVLAGVCGTRFLAVMSAVAAGLVCYDIFSKRLGMFKDVAVAALMTSLYPLAFSLTDAVWGPRAKALFIFPVWLFFTALAFEMLKDVRDVRGDKRASARGIADYSGRGWFLTLARVIVISASIIAILPFVFGYCKWVYLWFALGAIALAVVSVLQRPSVALRYIYAECALVTAGSMADLLVLGP